MQNTKIIVILMTVLIAISAVMGVFLGIRQETGEKD